jgi:tetratricopeptide (TPR) repeat protein
VLEAFRGASAEFASDAEPPNAPERLLRVLRAVYQLMRHAFEEISTIDARRSYLSSLEGEGGAEGANALRAEADFRQGIEALRSQDWTAAFTAFSSAAAKNPEESEYYLYMGIARMHQNTPSVEAALADAEEALWRASAAAPHNAEPLFQLGKVAMKKGELERAQNLFERALRCNPQHERTLNSLAQVQTKLSKGLGSKLGSLFGGR